MDLPADLSRRQALGLGALGVIGVSVTGSALLRGDAPSDAAHPSGKPTAPPIAVRKVKVTPRPPVTPTPIPVRRVPAFKIRDVLPDAPPHSVALTIDDGPSREWTPKVLDLLDRHGVKATFCVIGVEVRENP